MKKTLLLFMLLAACLLLTSVTSFAQNVHTYMQVLDTKGQTTMFDVSEISEITFVEYEMCGTITVNGTAYEVTKMVLDEKYRMYEDAYWYNFYSGDQLIAYFGSLYEQGGNTLGNYFEYWDESMITAGITLLGTKYAGNKYSYSTWGLLKKSDFQEGTISVSLDRTAKTLSVSAEGTTNDGTTFKFDLEGKVSIIEPE